MEKNSVAVIKTLTMPLFSFNRLLFDKEALEEKHLHHLQVSLAVFYARTDQTFQEVESVRTAKWQYTRTWEDKQDIQILKTEIEHLKDINCQENKKHNIDAANEKENYTNDIQSKNTKLEQIESDHGILKDLFEKQTAKYFNLLQRNKEMLEKQLRDAGK